MKLAISTLARLNAGKLVPAVVQNFLNTFDNPEVYITDDDFGVYLTPGKVWKKNYESVRAFNSPYFQLMLSTTNLFMTISSKNMVQNQKMLSEKIKLIHIKTR